MAAPTRTTLYHGGGFDVNGYKREREFTTRIMKYLESHELVNDFLRKFVNRTWDVDEIPWRLVSALILGKILLSHASANKVQDEVVAGESKARFYSGIHQIAAEMPDVYRTTIARIQDDPAMKMRPDGILILDEHVIPHSSEGIEGVSWFHSTTEGKPILGHSMISVHYYRKNVEYPVDFRFYRRLEELQAHDAETMFKEKNEIARELFLAVCQMPGVPYIVVMDSYFMTKENVTVLKKLKRHYVSRPKRNWNVNYEGTKYSLVNLFNTIPTKEFKETKVTNPKTKAEKKYLVATRIVFIPKIGMHVAVFIDCTKPRPENKEAEDAEAITTDAGRKFRVFVASNLEWDAATILSIYMLRWTIETSYRDMNQDLDLHGCKWRELDGQYCFIVLTFLCYLFLMWAKVHGFLTGDGVQSQTLGQLKEEFTHYCQGQLIEYISSLKQQCQECKLMDWIFHHVYSWTAERPWKEAS